MATASIAKVLTGTLLIVTSIGCAYSQAPATSQYPSKPLRIITSGPGGAPDINTRILAEGISGGLNQNVVVEIRPTFLLPAQAVARAQPDGYTLLVSGGALWVSPLLQDNLPYNLFKDFAPIALIYTSAYVLVAHPSLQANSIKELIALVKARPGAIKYAASGAGSGSTLAGVLFTHMTGSDIQRIPYKGTNMISDLLAGRVELFWAPGGQVNELIKAGKLKALGHTAPKPSPLFPGLPPIAETIPGYQTLTAGGFFAPAKTPAGIVKRLNEEAARVLSRGDIKEKLLASGSEPAPPGSPELLMNFMKSEMARLGPVIKATGLRDEAN